MNLSFFGTRTDRQTDTHTHKAKPIILALRAVNIRAICVFLCSEQLYSGAQS